MEKLKEVMFVRVYDDKDLNDQGFNHNLYATLLKLK